MIDISIIIPAYNAEKTIGYCLDSIILQMETLSYEIIVIDDGSVDATSEIIFSYQSKCEGIKYIWQENQKQSVARNRGLEVAAGKYIFFFDADDVIVDGMIAKMYQLINLDTNDLVVCGIKKVFCSNDSSKEVLELHSAIENSASKINSYLINAKEMDVGLWNKVFKKSIIDGDHIRFDNGNFFEDNLFVLQYLLSMQREIAYVNEAMYVLYKRGGSTTTNFNPDIVKYGLDYINKVNEICQRKGVALSTKVRNSFTLRIYLHIMHHNIKNNMGWNYISAKELQETFSISFFTIIHNCLSRKFKLAVTLNYFSPSLYAKLYKRMMSH